MGAVTPKASNHDGLDAKASRFVDVESLPWEPSQFPGVEFKTLLVDEHSGLLTTLMRMAPGAKLPDHEHMQIEQSYVLECRRRDGNRHARARLRFDVGRLISAAVESHSRVRNHTSSPE